jgi:predicted Zn-dependent peptidase
VNGSEASLAAIKHADVTRFYQEHVGADRLIVAVAGDFKTSQMKQMLQRAFSGWRRAGAPLPALTKPAPMNTRRVLLVDAPDAVQSYFWAANLGVAKNDPRRAALDVVNTVFGGRFTSMLNTELRIRTGLTYGANTRFNRLSQWGDWQLSSFTRTEKTIEAIDLAFATLDKLHVGGLDAAQLDSSKRYLQGQFPPTLETAVQWAGQLASFEFYGLSRDYIDGYSAAVAAVSLDDAKRVISEVVPASDRVVLVVIGKAAAIRDGLRKYGPVAEMKLSDPQFQQP